MLQEQIDRLSSCKLTESSSSMSSGDHHQYDNSCSRSQGFTASCTTDFSGLSMPEVISPSELAQSSYQPRRRASERQSEQEESSGTFFPWSKPKRRCSEPVVHSSNGQPSNSSPRHHHDDQLSSPQESKNGWFISGESERSANEEQERRTYFPWSKPKRRFSEPVNNSHGQKTSNSTPARHHGVVQSSTSDRENKNGWFISDESETSYLSNFIFGGDSSTKAVEEEANVQVRQQRRCSMPCNTTAPTTHSFTSPHPRRNSFLNASKRSGTSKSVYTINESYRSYVQSEKTGSSDGGDQFKSVVWGDYSSDGAEDI